MAERKDKKLNAITQDEAPSKVLWKGSWPETNRLADQYPMLGDGYEFDSLKRSIESTGQLHPIMLDEAGKIVAGRNRYRACMELGIEPKTETLDPGVNVREFVIADNTIRRSDTRSQRVAVALLGRTTWSQAKVAALIGVSEAQVSRVVAAGNTAVRSGVAKSYTDALSKIAYGEITEGALRKLRDDEKKDVEKERKITESDKVKVDNMSRASEDLLRCIDEKPEAEREPFKDGVRRASNIAITFNLSAQDMAKILSWADAAAGTEDEDDAEDDAA